MFGAQFQVDVGAESQIFVCHCGREFVFSQQMNEYDFKGNHCITISYTFGEKEKFS